MFFTCAIACSLSSPLSLGTSFEIRLRSARRFSTSALRLLTSSSTARSSSMSIFIRFLRMPSFITSGLLRIKAISSMKFSSKMDLPAYFSGLIFQRPRFRVCDFDSADLSASEGGLHSLRRIFSMGSFSSDSFESGVPFPNLASMYAASSCCSLGSMSA